MECTFWTSVFLIVGVLSAITSAEVYGIEQDTSKFQGDIDFPPTFRNGLINENTKWPNGILPYEFLEAEGYEYQQYHKDKIINALKDMENTLMVNGKKCLIFRPRNGETGYLFFVNGKNSLVCHSPVGRPFTSNYVNLGYNCLAKGTIQHEIMHALGFYHEQSSLVCHSPVGQPWYKNYVNLGYNCLAKGTIQHEIMHALGFFHEQSRSDRDDFVIINWDNMSKGNHGQFRKYPATKVTAYGEPYDYNSILHYGTNYFSNNGRPTITPKKAGVRIGQRSKMSLHDIRKIQKRYGCAVTPIPTLPPVGKALFSCDFESSSWCGLQPTGSAERWSLQNKNSDWFVSFQVRSDEVKSFERNSYIAIQKLEFGNKYCLSFSHRVDGGAQIAVKARNSVLSKVTASGQWQESKTTVTAPSKYDNDLRIFVSVGANTFGNAQVDKIKLNYGSC